MSILIQIVNVVSGLFNNKNDQSNGHYNYILILHNKEIPTI